LNLVVLRGFATLEALSTASSADIYDQETNPLGTQRDLNKAHAQECFAYAEEAMSSDPTASPRAFPEVVLNVRPGGLGSVTLIDTDGEQIAAASIGDPAMHEDLSGKLLEVVVHPHRTRGAVLVSRVDGNHRLHAAAENKGSIGASAVIPYALYINLDVRQEAGLFVDLNSKQHKMNTSHLKTLTVTTTPATELLHKDLPLYLADQLVQPGQAFYDVYKGGSKTGLRKRHRSSGAPAKLINFNTIETVVRHGYKAMSVGVVEWVRAASAAAVDGRGVPAEERDLQIEKMVAETWTCLASTFWLAVATVYAAEWNSKDYIVKESIGLTALSRYWAHITQRHLTISDAHKQDPKLDDARSMREFFEKELRLTKGVNLKKGIWAGYAGAGGATKVYEELQRAAAQETSTAHIAAARINRSGGTQQAGETPDAAAE